MRTTTLILIVLLASCSGIDPERLPGPGDFERWVRTCSADGAVSTDCLRAQAVAWALDAGQEGNLLSVLADLWAWWAATPHAAEASAPTLSGDLGACPTSPLLWRGYYAPSIDTWTGSSDQVLGIWGVIFSCVGRPERGDYSLDDGLKWSVVLRRFERQALTSFDDTLDCNPLPVLPIACEQRDDVMQRWSKGADVAMRRADVFGTVAQCVARHGGEVYAPWKVSLGAPVSSYRAAGLYLATCAMDGITCPSADESAGKLVLRSLP